MIKPGTVLAQIDDLPKIGAVPFQIDNHAILIVRTGSMIRAYINNCPHQNRPLSLPSGKVILSEDNYIVCPFHAASFDIDTGQCAGGPAGGSMLVSIPCSVAAGKVLADTP
jgi:nitrite reductase/ring-hydroxylating ferredoxin subunit